MILKIVIGATGDTLDFMLPAHVSLSSLMEEIRMLVEQTFQNVMISQDQMMLINLGNGQFLWPEWTLAQSRVQDGSRLMLL